MSPQDDITVILKRWGTDRESALNELTPVVYHELRKIAAGYLRRQRGDHTLQPTALINEVYLRLVRQDSATFDDRSHFFALAARVMRQILVDAARAHQAEKRGSGQKVQLASEFDAVTPGPFVDVLAVHEALDKLEFVNARAAQGIELRYFGGLQLEEIAEMLCVSLATLKRDLSLGEAWLRRALSSRAGKNQLS